MNTGIENISMARAKMTSDDELNMAKCYVLGIEIVPCYINGTLAHHWIKWGDKWMVNAVARKERFRAQGTSAHVSRLAISLSGHEEIWRTDEEMDA